MKLHMVRRKTIADALTHFHNLVGASDRTVEIDDAQIKAWRNETIRFFNLSAQEAHTFDRVLLAMADQWEREQKVKS